MKTSHNIPLIYFLCFCFKISSKYHSDTLNYITVPSHTASRSAPPIAEVDTLFQTGNFDKMCFCNTHFNKVKQ